MLHLRRVTEFQHMEFCDHCCTDSDGNPTERHMGAVIPFKEYYLVSDVTGEKIRLTHYYQEKEAYDNMEKEMLQKNQAESQTEYSQIMKKYSAMMKRKPRWLDEPKIDVSLAGILVKHGKYSKEYKEACDERGIPNEYR